MEKKKLQRIIGISVVVAFVIVLVPFIFGKRDMSHQEVAALTSPEQQSSSTSDNTASDTNQSKSVQAENTAADTNQTAMSQNNTNTANAPAQAPSNNAEDNGITPIMPAPVAPNQNAGPVAGNSADANTNNQPVVPSLPTNDAGQNTSATNTMAPVNPPSATPSPSSGQAAPVADTTAPAGDSAALAPAVSTEANDVAHPQAVAEQAAVVTPIKDKPKHEPKHIHKTLIVKKASHVAKANAANPKKPAWVVQMGSFKNKSNAHRLVDQLKTSGFKAFAHEVTSPAGAVRTRVYIGPEFKQASAQKLSARIEQQTKLQGFVVPYKPIAL